MLGEMQRRLEAGLERSNDGKRASLRLIEKGRGEELRLGLSVKHYSASFISPLFGLFFHVIFFKINNGPKRLIPFLAWTWHFFVQMGWLQIMSSCVRVMFFELSFESSFHVVSKPLGFYFTYKYAYLHYNCWLSIYLIIVLTFENFYSSIITFTPSGLHHEMT